MTLPTNQEIGARLQGFALRVAPAIAFAYTSGYETGTFVHNLNDRLSKLAVQFLGFVPK